MYLYLLHIQVKRRMLVSSITVAQNAMAPQVALRDLVVLDDELALVYGSAASVRSTLVMSRQVKAGKRR
jgi:hypothetical protein